ncbi:MAG TPA: hypothetical protein VG276_00615 [Actinomycetes bacterium]|jgi:hypothetical protein|nr:hypothetical protein [Actinomycetes bacterium]
MRRGGSLFVTILLLAGAFYLGVLYERNNCKIDVPQTASQVDNSVKCRDFRSNLPTVTTR